MTRYCQVLIAVLLIAAASPAQKKPVELPWDPRAIAVDSKDNLYIEFERMLMKITPEGQAAYITENIAQGFRGVVTPDAELMVAGADDNIYMTRPYFNSLWEMTPEGKFSILAAEERYQNAWAGPAKYQLELPEIEFMTIGKGNTLYISSRYNHSSTSVFYRYSFGKKPEIYKNKNGDTIKIVQVTAIAVDAAGNLYAGTVHERCIKKITAQGEVTVVAGLCGKRAFCPVYVQGDISKAELVQPGSMVFNKKGELFFADERMNRIIKVANNTVTTVAGNSLIQPCGSNMGGRSKEGYKDGKALTALFNFPEKVQLAIDSQDNIYMLDLGNNAVRKLTPEGLVSTVAINPK